MIHLWAPRPFGHPPSERLSALVQAAYGLALVIAYLRVTWFFSRGCLDKRSRGRDAREAQLPAAGQAVPGGSSGRQVKGGTQPALGTDLVLARTSRFGAPPRHRRPLRSAILPPARVTTAR